MLIAHIADDRGAVCPLPSAPSAASIAVHSRVGTRRDRHSRHHLGAFQGAAMERETVSGPDTEDHTAAMPEWRAYGRAVPHGYGGRGVAGPLSRAVPRCGRPR